MRRAVDARSDQSFPRRGIDVEHRFVHELQMQPRAVPGDRSVGRRASVEEVDAEAEPVPVERRGELDVGDRQHRCAHECRGRSLRRQAADASGGVRARWQLVPAGVPCLEGDDLVGLVGAGPAPRGRTVCEGARASGCVRRSNGCPRDAGGAAASPACSRTLRVVPPRCSAWDRSAGRREGIDPRRDEHGDVVAPDEFAAPLRTAARAPQASPRSGPGSIRPPAGGCSARRAPRAPRG